MSKPWSSSFFRAYAKASSRFGPTAPFVPASASVWQAPQFFWKSSLPPEAEVFSTRPTVPQADATAAIAVRAGRPPRSWRSTLRGRLPGAGRVQGLVAGGVDREHAVETGDLEDLRDVAVAADERQLPLVRP